MSINNISYDITTKNIGITGKSIGGNGGDGGTGGNLLGIGAGGYGGRGGDGGLVTIENSRRISTNGNGAAGIFGLSQGGNGGKGGNGWGLGGKGGSGGDGGKAGTVNVTNAGRISTSGWESPGILGQSLGGLGGSGGSGSGIYGGGGPGGRFGSASNVTINNRATINATGPNSKGIFAQSIGGGGGIGGGSGGLVSFGGRGGASGDGGTVNVNHSITSLSSTSNAIFAQSIGGGGGDLNSGSGGASWWGLFASIGGRGAGGGKGGPVSIKYNGSTDTRTYLTTSENNASAIFAQSLGGGGGNGGNAVAVGILGSFALGGAAAAGGSGGPVSVSTIGRTSINTSKDLSNGIFAQSLGGGGGSGGFAVAVAAGIKYIPAVSVSIGGRGGAGGGANTVTVNNQSSITTQGDNAYGIKAQSTGGGGGSGGFSVAGAFSDLPAVAVSLGGSGGVGGNGGPVNLNTIREIRTTGNNAVGVLAQSQGGGGGDGGFSVAVSGGGKIGAISFGLGGSGGASGAGGAVTVESGSSIHTKGSNAQGIWAQSGSNGGGKAGFSVSGALSVGQSSTGGALGISIGGQGGAGGKASAVKVESYGWQVETTGDNSTGIQAQSIGGGGGSGGASVSGALAVNKNAGAVAVAVGGSGGSGGTGGAVTVNNISSIETHGFDAKGIMAQSTGGKGGDGGVSVAVSAALGDALVDLSKGGLNYFSFSNLSLTLGGNGGKGGNSGTVTVDTTSAAGRYGSNTITTWGDNATGLYAQSVGGGGGSGAVKVNVAAGSSPYTGPPLIGDTPLINFGSQGGGGGNAADVTVTDNSYIYTAGQMAPGIFAQSLGGGGGKGGTIWNCELSFDLTKDKKSLNGFSLGASGVDGAGGGDAGQVTVTESPAAGANKKITTQGFKSPGIEAQSVGAGGGDGGYSFSANVSKRSRNELTSFFTNYTFAQGGKGGAGGSAGEVSVSAASDITTSGDKSQGILAQSLGGGGGNGGFALSFHASGTSTLADTFGIGGVSVALGGEGGSGGNAGKVTVTSRGSQITTAGNLSSGIFAQSQGKGGGSGGGAISLSGSFGNSEKQNFALSANVALGGKGGGGGAAGAVAVASQSNINTGTTAASGVFNKGNDSGGIVAQSNGGGGGHGGFSVEASGFLSKEKNFEGNFSLSMGGSGGNGNNGGPVEVLSNGATIQTVGVRSPGILAQSEGGGGGSGGFSIAGDITYTQATAGTLALSLGGHGGGGGKGDTVTVINQSTISTGSITAQGNSYGCDSPGILAQSLGGGGGAGGFSVAGNLVWKLAFGLGVGIGGSGGSGNSAEAVTVVNAGASIHTRGDRSPGIEGQSIGGGGGSGGFSLSNLSLGPLPVPVYVNVGGKEGSGQAGAVTMISTSDIATGGNDSAAILSQSIGAGGGKGAINVNENLTGASEVQVNLGNTSKAGSGNGNEILLGSTSGKISTAGKRASGIVAQSIGAGGGVGVIGVEGGVQTQSAKLSIGGLGSAGDGGTVAIRNDSEITATGKGSFGIVAQSIGAGGGLGSNDAVTTGAGVSLGGRGAASGKGSSVEVTNGNSITTSFAGSYGIIAQSIGGGGGLAAGNNAMNWVTMALTPGDGTNRGDGLQVSITNRGAIETKGFGAVGIVAQSIGGGGGLNLAGGQAGSAGGSGSAGEVTILHQGSIVTRGDYAHGILAQSAGGQGSGGNVSITVADNSSIATSGREAFGILAQSSGNTGQGKIAVEIAASGSVVCTGEKAVGVGFLGGKNNVLNNYGTVQADKGLAVMSNPTDNTTVNNYGTITGSLELGNKENFFNNKGTFRPGITITMGELATLTYTGPMSFGNDDLVTTTTLYGSLVQTPGSSIGIDLDHKSGAADKLVTTGTAKISGEIKVDHFNLGYIKPGTSSATIIDSAGTADVAGLAVSSSPVIVNQLVNAEDLMLRTTVNFNPPGLTKNQQVMGDYINRVQSAGGAPGALDPLLETLITASDTNNLGATYDSLLPYTPQAATLATISVNRHYLRTFQNRLEWRRPYLWGESGSAGSSFSQRKPVLLAYNGPDEQLGQFLPAAGKAARLAQSGFWVDGFSQFADSSATGFKGFDYTMAGFCAGFDYALTDQAIIGVGGGYAGTNLNLDANWGHSYFNSYYATLYGTYFTDKIYLEGVLSYGRHQYRDSHVVDLGISRPSLSSSHDGDSFSAALEGGYTFKPKNFVIQPFAGLSYSLLTEGSFAETGAGGLGLKVESRQSNALASELGLRLARPFQISRGSIVPLVSAAWIHNFTVDNFAVPAAFAATPNIGFVLPTRDLGSDRALVGAQIAFVSKAGVSVALRYEADLGQNFTSQGISGRLALAF